MNIWSKVITALHNSDSLADNLPLDSQAMKILDEEVRNSTQSLLQLQKSLKQMQQQQWACQEQQQKLTQAIGLFEGYAVKAIEQTDDDLALEIAKKIAELEAELQHCQQQADYCQSQCEQLEQVMELMQQNLLRLRHQVDRVRASENVHRAQQSVVSRQASDSGKIPTAMDALQRLKQRQLDDTDRKDSPKKAVRKARNVPDNLLEDKALQQRLIEAGIIDADPDVSEIMQRLRQQASNQ